MISIIVCSIDKKLRDNFEKNVAEYIGCEYEFLYKDNTTDIQGLCNVYNTLAVQARGEYLCFVHEDVTIETKGWGLELQKLAKDKEVGVIGFVGGGTVSGYPYWQDRITPRSYFEQRLKDGSLYHQRPKRKDKEDLKEVVVLDGMFLFCQKEVWQEYPFDDATFQGFHLYDMDFTLSVAQKYKNFVCYTVDFTHYSLGNVSDTYFVELAKFYDKWQNVLPYTVYPEIFERERKKYEEDNLISFLKLIMYNTYLPSSYIHSYLKRIGALNNIKSYLILSYYLLKKEVRDIVYKRKAPR